MSFSGEIEYNVFMSEPSSSKLNEVSPDVVERAILANIKTPSQTQAEVEESIEELARLSSTAGAIVVDKIIQPKSSPDPKFFIGKGKVEEIKSTMTSTGADLVIFDEELTSTQQYNLQKELGIKVLDRTALILDIFAQHARSYEGKLQVDLAQLTYLLPRLKGRGIEMSRLGGGIGTRGPGETKLEVDRRRIRKRIKTLSDRLEHLGVNRSIQRKKRKKSRVPVVSIVGYTNAGKSTLLNTLTGARARVEDKLFSTLDSSVKRLNRGQKGTVLFSDTVGFINKLPHQLIASFKSTLEEIKESDLLLHIVDPTNTDLGNHLRAVEEVLTEIGAINKRTILVFNKIDLLDRLALARLKEKYREAVFISAQEETGVDNLITRIEKALQEERISLRLRIPFGERDVLAATARQERSKASGEGQ